MFTLPKKWPPDISRTAASLQALAARVQPGDHVGLDLEWNRETKKTTIVGMAQRPDWCASLGWTEETMRATAAVAARHPFWIGHNFVDAEVPALAADNINIPLEEVGDTIILHWLCNSHLCKAKVDKDADGEDGGRKGPGYMNLGTMLSLYTNFPHYKTCHGDGCEGSFQPCPEHYVYGYNAVDSLGPVVAYPALWQHARLIGVDHLYPFHVQLMACLHRIRERGVPIDTAYVDTLRSTFAENKNGLGDDIIRYGFSPTSPQQIKKFFRENFKIDLNDTLEDTIREWVEDEEWDSPVVQSTRSVLPRKKPTKKFLRELEERGDTYPEYVMAEAEEGEYWRARVMLEDLLEFKELGKGADAWFGPEYVKDALAHPRLNPFTSTARLACSNPNYQNIPKRRIDRKLFAQLVASGVPEKDAMKRANIGKKMRQAIAAPEGTIMWDADYTSGENLIMMWQAGHTDLPHFVPGAEGLEDLHDYVAALAEFTETDALSIKEGGARGAAKTVQHGGNYLEGLSLKTAEELRRPGMVREIAAGARVVYWDWTFLGYIVTFTGSHLAERAFGDKTLVNRAKALEIQGRYFKRFRIRELQRRILRQNEETGMIQPPHGYALASFGNGATLAADRAKTAAATFGSQPLAHFSKIALMKAEQTYLDPRLQIHDELIGFPDRGKVERLGLRRVAADIQEVMDTRFSGPPEFQHLYIPAAVKFGWNFGETMGMEKFAKENKIPL